MLLPVTLLGKGRDGYGYEKEGNEGTINFHNQGFEEIRKSKKIPVSTS
jgi:hypothetical protein